MSYTLAGIFGQRQPKAINIRPISANTYDGLVASFGDYVTSYYKLEIPSGSTATDEKGVQNGTLFGTPERNVETIVDLDTVAEGAAIDGKCIAFTGAPGEYMLVPHNTAQKTDQGTIAITFQRDTANEKAILLDSDDVSLGSPTANQAGGLGMEVNIDGSIRGFLRGADLTPVVLVGEPGNVQLNRAYTMFLKYGPSGFSLSLWDDQGVLVRRLQNVLATGRTGNTSPLRFGMYLTDVGHHDGPIARIVLMNRRLTDSEEGILARARTIYRSFATEGKYVSLSGSDANPGTIDHPFRTIPYGASQLSPGETLWVRGGRYAGDITITASGTAAAPITIASYPGEIAIIDVNYAEFQSPGGWELDPASPAGTEVYRSLGTNYGTGGTGRGTFWVNDEEVGTVLSGMRQYLAIAMIRATVYTWVSTYEYYGGPGFCYDGGRIYVRVQNLASPRNAGIPAAATVTPLGDIRNHPPSAGGFNPNNFVINISNVRQNIRIQGSYITLSRLAVYGAQYGIIIDGGHHITIERCRLWGATHPVNNSQATHDNIVRWCDIASGFSPCFSWNEVHTTGTDQHPRMESKIWSQSGLGDENNLLYQNYVHACFDGCTAISNTTRNLRIIGNTILFLFDDLIQFSSQATFEVGWNYITGPGPGYNGGVPGSGEATKFVHHNILEDRRGEFGWRLGMENANGGGSAWRDSHNPFASHSVEADCNTPIKLYNNMILYRNNINARGARMERVGAKTAGVHESYNNIVFGFVNANCYMRNATVGVTDQIHDYNLLWHTGSYIVALFRDMLDTPNNDYATLTLWRASQSFQNTKAVYAPGFEANSKEADPVIPAADGSAYGTPDMDYRPSAAGPAASGAKSLSGTGWPGADDAGYFGAVSPVASTGLGNVGVPSGVLIGP